MLPIFFSTHWLNPHHLSVSGWLSPPQGKHTKFGAKLSASSFEGYYFYIELVGITGSSVLTAVLAVMRYIEGVNSQSL